jgi:hypothetical protein
MEEILLEEISVLNNFAHLREAIDKATPPLIPYLRKSSLQHQHTFAKH